MTGAGGRALRVALSGGETGGHLHPAAAIASDLKERAPGCRCIFVGASGRMAMDQIFRGFDKTHRLRIGCLDRRRPGRNLFLPGEFVASVIRSLGILKDFRPHVVVGVGGFPSGPFLFSSWLKGIPVLIVEPNAVPGLTHRIMKRIPDRVCASFPGMERWFRPETLALTGAPVRRGLQVPLEDARTARRRHQLTPDKPLLLFTGGSLGSRLINETVLANRARLSRSGVQIVWQTGTEEYDLIRREGLGRGFGGIRVVPYLARIEELYALADLVVCAAGAITLSELALLGKPSIIVPSPDVTEDHQTWNARRLSEGGGCVMLLGDEARRHLVSLALNLIADPGRLAALGDGIRRFSRPDACALIGDEILALAGGRERGTDRSVGPRERPIEGGEGVLPGMASPHPFA